MWRRCGTSASSDGSSRPRGFHLITREVADCAAGAGAGYAIWRAHLHLMHTSASLTLNENASPDVRRDFASWFDRAVPERGRRTGTHTDEGDDDMPAHVKASLLGFSLTLPVSRRSASPWGRGRGSTCASIATAAAPRSLLATPAGRGTHMTTPTEADDELSASPPRRATTASATTSTTRG